MNKRIIMTGATGMAGSLLLQHCLESEEVAHVTSLLRKPSGIDHPKLKEILLDDFTELSGLEQAFTEKDIAYFCLGVYTGSVPRDTFRKITVDMPVAFAEMLRAHSPNARLVLLSGAGADRSEKSRMMFAKDKGVAENRLSALFPGHFHAIRPGYIYPVEPRKAPNFSYQLMRSLYPLIRLMGNNYSIKSTELAKAMFRIGLQGTPEEILENRDILEQLK